MEIVRGTQVLVTVDPAFRTRGDANTVWVDYCNITRVVPVGGRIYIDDGLISLVVRKIGADRQVLPAHPLVPPSPLSPYTLVTLYSPPIWSHPHPNSYPNPGVGLNSWVGRLIQISTRHLLCVEPTTRPREKGKARVNLLKAYPAFPLVCKPNLSANGSLLSPCPQAQRGCRLKWRVVASWAAGRA